MNYRHLGKSGLQVSELSFGSWLTFGNQIGDTTAKDCMQLAYDNGINFFDNAEVYANGKSEEVMGKLLSDFGWKRDTYIVSSKVFWGGSLPTQVGLHRKHVMEACEAALKRLRVDYLDLYFCHRPDKNTPIEETVWTMHNLIQQGKILYWGTSEWSAQEIQAAHSAANRYNLIGPTMEQPEYNMFRRDRVEVEYDLLYRDAGMGTTIWSPLASGLLSGKYNLGKAENTRLQMAEVDWLKEKTLVDAKLKKVDLLMEIANQLGTEMPLLALAWCLKNSNVSTVITGASKVSQLKQNLQATEVVNLLTNDIIEIIEEVLKNKPKQPTF